MRFGISFFVGFLLFAPSGELDALLRKKIGPMRGEWIFDAERNMRIPTVYVYTPSGELGLLCAKRPS